MAVFLCGTVCSVILLWLVGPVFHRSVFSPGADGYVLAGTCQSSLLV